MRADEKSAVRAALIVGVVEGMSTGEEITAGRIADAILASPGWPFISTCDDYDCAGFTTPRAKPEPVPDPPLRVATDAARRAYIAEALANVEQVRRALRGSK